MSFPGTGAFSPYSGMMHGSGCFETPKIGLLNATTIENITKHFINDYSIEAQVPCAPCHRIIDSAKLQCPVDMDTKSCWFMAHGIDPMLIVKKIEDIVFPVKEESLLYG